VVVVLYAYLIEILIYVNDNYRYGVTTRSIIIRACANIISRKFEVSDSLLRSAIEEDTRSNNGHVIDKSAIKLTFAQSLVARGKYVEAKEVISSIKELRHTPAGVSAMFALDNLQSSGSGGVNTASLVDALNEISSTHSFSSPYSESLAMETLSYIAEIFQHNNDHGNCIRAYKEILSKGVSTLNTTQRLLISAKLSLSMSHVNPSESERYLSSLPQVILFKTINFYYINISCDCICM
jgi:hypothetical protein